MRNGKEYRKGRYGTDKERIAWDEKDYMRIVCPDAFALWRDFLSHRC